MNSVSLSNLSASPVSLSTAKAWLRIDHTDDDPTIQQLIDEATSEIERTTGRLLRQATGTLKLDSLPDGRTPIVVPFPPLRSVTSMTYTDAAGSQQAITPILKLYAFPGELNPPNTGDWPKSKRDTPEAVEIVFECGDTPGDDAAELLGCLRIILELGFHDVSPQQHDRLERRRDSILRRWKLRDSRLRGITHV